MTQEMWVGLATVLLAGAFQGSFLLPSKWVKGWEWENYWLPFAATAYLIAPWALALATIPDLAAVYRGAPPETIAWVLIFGVGWGVGAVTFGLGVDAIGLALGFAVILGVAATSGTLVPLLLMPPDQFSTLQGVVTAASLATMLVGVAVCSFAGRWREGENQNSEKPRTSYRLGLLICVASGLLSSCGNLGFAWGEPIYGRAVSQGVAAHVAPNALWPILTVPLFLCNAGFAVRMLWKNGTAARYRISRTGINMFWSLVMGALWMAGMGLYGAGANRLGELGKSLGWSILMSSMVLVANALGVLSGEWRGAPRASRRQLALGILILLAAIAGLGYANSLG